MSKNAYKEFEKQVKKHIDNYKKNNVLKGSITDESGYDFNLLNNLDIFRQSDDKNKLYFGWNWMKWYDGYEEVDSIMDSLNKLEDKGYGYSYGRIGESMDDYEEMYVKCTPKDNIDYLEVPPFYRYFEDARYENNLLHLVIIL